MRASTARVPRAISSSPTSRKARAACAISTRVLDRQICLPRARCLRAGRGRAVHGRASGGSFARCEEFLWRVRCHLHFLTGRAEERLTFDVQRAIAEQLGYDARGGLSGVERFMKHYFLDRQGRRRSDRDRLRGARRTAGEAARHARPLHRPLRRRSAARCSAATISSSKTAASTSRDDDVVREAIRSTSSACSGSPTSTICASIPMRRASSRTR